MFFYLRSCFLVILSLGSFLLTYGSEADSEDQSKLFSSSGEGINFSRGGNIRLPLFSSVDGFVTFMLSARDIEPAERKAGVFSLPRHGYATESILLDFRSGALDQSDWSQILKICQQLRHMDIAGSIVVNLPDGPVLQANAIDIADDMLFFRVSGDNPNPLWRMAYDAETKRIIYSKLQPKPTAQ